MGNKGQATSKSLDDKACFKRLGSRLSLVFNKSQGVNYIILTRNNVTLSYPKVFNFAA